MFQLKRYGKGPIFTSDPNLPWEREGVFNPGVIKDGKEVIMLYRAVGETEAGISRFGLAKSKDGINFERASREPVFGPSQEFDKWSTEDPRIVKIGDEYYITYVAVPKRIMLDGKSFPRNVPLETCLALLRTKDFISFENLGVISSPASDNKDGVLFPKKINGRYCMLHRPNFWHRTWCDHLEETGEKANWSCELEDLPQFPAIWLAWSDDLKNWDNHRMILHTSHDGDAKIGAGLTPIETKDGWLLIYHHVSLKSGETFSNYSIRAALFDLDDPSKLLGKLSYDILYPEMPYELERGTGIIFPTGGFVMGDALHVYYGASDRYICLATGSLTELLLALKNSI